MSTTPNDPWQSPSEGDPPPPPPGGGWQQPGGAPPPPGGGWQQPGAAPPPPPGGWQQPGAGPPPPGGGWQQPGAAPPPPPGGWQQPPGGYSQPGGYGQWQQPGGYTQWQQQPYPGASGALAGWWYRVGATLVDFLVLIIPEAIISVAAGNSIGARYAVSLILQALYVTLLLGSSGRTVGMRALGTHVIDARTGGQITYGKAFLRWLGQIALGITIIGGILDIFWPLWDRQNQTLHDKMVGTVLLRR